MLLYVDDIPLFGEGIKAIEDTKRMLMRGYPRTDLGIFNAFVRLQVVREPKTGRIRLVQGKYIRVNAGQVRNGGLQNSFNTFTRKLDGDENMNIQAHSYSQDFVRCLLYLSDSTRPDISYTVLQR